MTGCRSTSARIASVALGLLFLMCGGGPLRAQETETEEVWATARQRGVIYEDCAKNADRLLQGWLDREQDPDTHLFSRGGRWDYHNEAADHYSSLVLIARHVRPAVIEEGGALHKTLTRSIELCETESGLPTTYYLRGDRRGRPARPGHLAEWLRDGLVRIVEVLGTENDWYREMERLTDALLVHAAKNGGMSKVFRSSEDAGNMLQTLARLYAMSGRKRYLRAAEALADDRLLGSGSGIKRIRFGDHGCELVPGLGELFALECQLGRRKADQYREPLRELLDRILESGAHPRTGLFCSSKRADNGALTWSRPPDTWGYVLFTYENYDRGTGGDRYEAAIKKPLAWLATNFQEHAKLKGALWPRAGSSDDWSDSYESFVVLWNRYPDCADGFAWLDWATRQHIHRRRGDRKYGPYTGGHFDGSTGRTLCLHMMLCSQGVRALPFKPGLRLGAVQKDGALYLSLECEEEWTGKLFFDSPRTKHKAAALDWARINEMPQWFVARPGRKYRVASGGSGSRVFDGRRLIGGIELTIKPGQRQRFVVRPLEGE